MTANETEATPQHSGPWRVVLVDDHAIFRAGVRHELGKASGRVTVVGEGEDVATSVAVITATLPDVVLLDVHLPGGGGAEVVKQVHVSHPEVKFLALSVSDAAEDVIGVIRAGARGYVTKSIATPNSSRRSDESRPVMRSSRPGWPASCWTRSQGRSMSRPSTRTSTASANASARCSS